MQTHFADASALLDEYITIVQESGADCLDSKQDAGAVQEGLVREADWTPEAADALLGLARDYGAFMLRNALALAVVLDIEDGSLGY